MKRRERSKSKLMRTLLILALFAAFALLKLGGRGKELTDNGYVLQRPQQGLSQKAAVAQAETPSPSPAETLLPADPERQRLSAEIAELGALYRHIYEAAEKLPSPYFHDEEQYVSQSAVDEIESLLIDSGLCIMNSDGVYPAYIENAQHMIDFRDSVKQGRDSDAVFWGVSEKGTLYCRRLRYYRGGRSCLNVSTKWGEDGQLHIDSYEQREIFDWLMTARGDIIYRDLITDRHWTAAKLLRLTEPDRALCDLKRRYIDPVGYQNVNLFLLDWDSDDFGEVCFNDLLSGLYFNSFAVRLDTTVYRSIEGTSYNAVPAETFEKALLPYFELSQSRLRTLAHYDGDCDAYPYNSFVVSYDSYYPEVTAEVTDFQAMPDGSLRLSVNVLCPDLNCDSVFCHELTVKPCDGGFKYISNRVTYKADIEQPSSKPGVDMG